MPILRAVSVLAVALVSSCSERRWHASVYPNRADLTNVRDLGEFPTLEDCRHAATTYLRDMGSPYGDYECGKNCVNDATVGETKLYRCEETTR